MVERGFESRSNSRVKLINYYMDGLAACLFAFPFQKQVDKHVNQVDKIFLSPSDTLMRQSKVQFYSQEHAGFVLVNVFLCNNSEVCHLGKFDLPGFHFLQLDWKV